MVTIKTTCPLKNFRNFMILSCCYSFIPSEYLDDETIFPEREAEHGSIYIEAKDKQTLKKIREIQFTKAEQVIGAIYNSKSGSTKLKWEHTSGLMGNLNGEASIYAVLNLVEAGVIDESSIRKPTMLQHKKIVIQAKQS
jgi:hypothetical protein